ncbi:hypothetical protein M6B38_236730 [Iris pallida]|uniref:Uncharacterized protein n=1 Tax=Iris pallida TaxID=29817 RepID=A0AAX6DNP2_IRIPA|nr:hypothetical protein M6B38_236730 [Iris pallida]
MESGPDSGTRVEEALGVQGGGGRIWTPATTTVVLG